MLLGACLGVEVDAGKNLIRFSQPCLPAEVSELQIEGLRLRDSVLDLHFTRENDGRARVKVIEKQGHVEVVEEPA